MAMFGKKKEQEPDKDKDTSENPQDHKDIELDVKSPSKN